MILILEIAMLLVGLVFLSTGRVSLSRKRALEGQAIRYAGAVLLFPIPVCYLLGFYWARQTDDLDAMLELLPYIELAVVCGFLLLALACVALGDPVEVVGRAGREEILTALPADEPAVPDLRVQAHVPAQPALRPVLPAPTPSRKRGKGLILVLLGMAIGLGVVILLVAAIDLLFTSTLPTTTGPSMPKMAPVR